MLGCSIFAGALAVAQISRERIQPTRRVRAFDLPGLFARAANRENVGIQTGTSSFS